MILTFTLILQINHLLISREGKFIKRAPTHHYCTDFVKFLKLLIEGESPNNISPIIKYWVEDGAKILWMGDLETEFMDNIKNNIKMEPADIIFAPHHGRDTGKVPEDWLDSIDPKIIIIGEAPSKDLNYYYGHNTITQNSAGDITLDCYSGKTHIYVSNPSYFVNFLDNENMPDDYGKYIGTLNI